MDFLQIKPTTKHGFDIAVFARFGTNAFHKFTNAGITCKIKRNVILGFTATYCQLLRQAKGAHAIHQTKINRFCSPTLITADFIQWNTKYFGSRGFVHVLTAGKGFY